MPVEVVAIPSRPDQAYYYLEPYIEGEYIKFNKNGLVNEFQEIYHPILQTFSHFTYCYSEGKMLVTDIQGAVQDQC